MWSDGPEKQCSTVNRACPPSKLHEPDHLQCISSLFGVLDILVASGFSGCNAEIRHMHQCWPCKIAAEVQVLTVTPYEATLRLR